MLVYILGTLETSWNYKIGHTKAKSCHARIRAIQTSSPHKIVVIWQYSTIYYKELEKMTHAHYKHLRCGKTEWFNFENTNIEEVKEKILTFEKIIKLLENNEKNSD